VTDPLLAIDAGNTRIKWGLCDGGRWLSAGFVDTEDCARLSSRLDRVPQHIIISNVAGGEVEAGLLVQLSGAGRRIHVIRSLGAQCGVKNSYRNPAQLGTDRWAALIGARRLGSGAKLVVVAGTAMTIDALTAEGVFLGGVIVPGLMLMRGALHANTAQLGVAPGQIDAFPKETGDAIASGAIQASVGAVMRLREALRAHVQAEPECIVSGGAASLLTPHLPFPAAIQDNLVLDGLVVIAKEIFTR
jgi:type III pantothenate kinase